MVFLAFDLKYMYKVYIKYGYIKIRGIYEIIFKKEINYFTMVDLEDRVDM